jgi:hypothetical protein
MQNKKLKIQFLVIKNKALFCGFFKKLHKANKR